MLQHREPDALGHATRDLPFDDQRVDHAATVLDYHIALYLTLSGFRINFHNCNMRRIGIWRWRLVVIRILQTWLVVFRDVRIVNGGPGDLAHCHASSRD